MAFSSDVHGTSSKDVMDLLVLNQYFDTIQVICKSTLIPFYCVYIYLFVYSISLFRIWVKTHTQNVCSSQMISNQSETVFLKPLLLWNKCRLTYSQLFIIIIDIKPLRNVLLGSKLSKNLIYSIIYRHLITRSYLPFIQKFYLYLKIILLI